MAGRWMLQCCRSSCAACQTAAEGSDALCGVAQPPHRDCESDPALCPPETTTGAPTPPGPTPVPSVCVNPPRSPWESEVRRSAPFVTLCEFWDRSDLREGELMGMCYYWQTQGKCDSAEEVTALGHYGNINLTAGECHIPSAWQTFWTVGGSAGG